MYLPTADGGACVTDAAREALALADLGRRRHRGALDGPAAATRAAGGPAPRFGFTLPGSVHGFTATDGATVVRNGGGHLDIGAAATVLTPTFIPPEARQMPIYGLVASPTLYPGQTVRARVDGTARLVIQAYAGDDEPRTVECPDAGSGDLAWTVPDLGGQPVVAVGVRTDGPARLHHLTWDGAPDVTLTRPADGGTMWRRAWVPALDRFDERWPEPFRIGQNRGTGMLITGARQWRDYTVTADVTPHLAAGVGLAARVQGLDRYYALELTGRDTVRLMRGSTVLAASPYPWTFGRTYRLSLACHADRIRAGVDGTDLFDLHDQAYDCGGVALSVTEGRTATHDVRVTPFPIADRSPVSGRTPVEEHQ
jgi:hypothetical protein